MIIGACLFSRTEEIVLCAKCVTITIIIIINK